MNALSHDQECSQASQSGPIYDSFASAARVFKTDVYLANPAMLVGKNSVVSLT
jgi:hypothetical protein